MIGRCSYDSGPSSTDGTFRAGNAVANFYRVQSASGDVRIMVAHGISLVDGSILSQTDAIEIKDQGKTDLDQGALWPLYELSIESRDPVFKGFWIDGLAKELAPDHPQRSGFGYPISHLGNVETATGVSSFLQNSVVGRGTIYPYCAFWEAP